jgi:hypothetical protein
MLMGKAEKRQIHSSSALNLRLKRLPPRRHRGKPKLRA